MQKRSKIALYIALCVAVGVISSGGYAHAQTSSSLPDAQIEIIVAAAIIGALGAPIVAHASQEDTATSPADPFNWRAYAGTVPILLVTGIGIILAELTAITITGSGLEADIILFGTVFINALGVNALKTGISQAIANNATPAPASSSSLSLPPTGGTVPQI